MKTTISLAVLMIWASVGFAQNYLDILRPFQGMEGRSGVESGVNPMGGGGSNALTGNPALLSEVEKSFLALDLSYDRVNGSSVYDNMIWDKTEKNDLKFNSLTYIHPVRVYRGAWVWGVSIHPITSYSSVNQFSDIDGDFYYRHRSEEIGSLYAYTLATSFLATMNTSLGFSMSILNGHNDASKVYAEKDITDAYTFADYVDSLHFAPEYWGFSARVGLTTELSDVLQLGASFEFPSRISVSETSSHLEVDLMDDGSQIVYEDEERAALSYASWGPWRMGIGLGFVNEPLRASINYRYHSYTGVSFVGDILDPDTGGDVGTQIQHEIDQNIDNVNEFSASLQWSLRPVTLSFAGTVMNDPLNYHLDNIVRLDTGFGYQLASGLGLTVAYRSEQWQSDLNHSIDDGSARAVEVQNTFSKIQFGIKYIF